MTPDLHIDRMFVETVAEHPDRVATAIHGSEVTQTYAQLDAAVQRLARGLVALGVRAGDRVALLSRNRPEWTLVDLACHRAGAVPVPLYPSSTTDQVAHIVADSGADVLVVEGPALVGATEGVQIGHRISIDDVDGLPSLADCSSDDSAHDEELQRRAAHRSGDDIATLIYTSGTTGLPKGVVLTHGGILSQIAALDELFPVTPQDHSLCFLPLSHAFERAWTYYVLSHGCRNTYLVDPKEIAAAMVEVQPTLLVSVPRLFEKVYATAHEKAAGSPVRKVILRWALRVGGKAQRAHRKGRTASWWWRMQLPLADRLVFRSLRAAIGGPKTVLASGGAPLREEIEEFFSSAGVLVCQGYGLTEASPLVSFNAPGAFKFGTVGRIMSGAQVRIGEHGEILFRGPNVMRGYWNNAEATTAAVDADGWLHTGDAGYVDTDGYLVITDRIKDILVTSGGKNVAPQPIEGLVLADPLFEYAVLLGDRRPFLTLLVRPSLPQLEDLARELQVRWEHVEELWQHPEVVEAIKERVAGLTEKLPSHERIKDLRVMAEEFTQDNGLLTPTLKVRRREVERRFSELIDDMYSRLTHMRDRGRGGE